MQVDKHQDIPVLRFSTLTDWIDWLEDSSESTPAGVWIQIAKKNTGVTTTTYEEVREGALCFGWIDGLTKRVDEIYYMIKLTPRRREASGARSMLLYVKNISSRAKCGLRVKLKLTLPNKMDAGKKHTKPILRREFSCGAQDAATSTRQRYCRLRN